MFSDVPVDYLLQGAFITLLVSAGSMVLSLTLGLLLAVARTSRLRVVSSPAAFWVWFVRGTPLLLQLIFLYAILPKVGLTLDSVQTAVIGFGLNDSAFVGEIIRGGILSVQETQKAAADSLGMSQVTKLRLVVLPQAMRAILPAMGNDAISLLKATSLGSVIALNELTLRTVNTVATTFNWLPVYLVAGLMYLVMTSALAAIQQYLEGRVSLERDRSQPSLARRFLGWGPIQRRPATVSIDRVVRSEEVEGGTDGSSPEHVSLDESLAETLERDDEPRRVVERPPAVQVEWGSGPFVECRDVWKSYRPGHPVLRGVNLSVAFGEVVVVMGPSGSGKSTLLRLINHLDAVDRGEITVGGEHVGYKQVDGTLKTVRGLAKARAAARIGMVFQHLNLFEHMTALENLVVAPVHVYHIPRAQAEDEGRRQLERVGLRAEWRRLPHELSGGQRQRVAIARALALHPRLMLFDEPTSALDPELVGSVLATMRDLAVAGLTMIVVTHEVRFARDVADRIVFIDDGRVVEEGPAKALLDNPREPRTRQFLQLVTQEEPNEEPR